MQGLRSGRSGGRLAGSSDLDGPARPAAARRRPAAMHGSTMRLGFAALVASLSAASTQALRMSAASSRYIATNRFQIRPGKEAAFEKRWAERKSSLLSCEGFRYFHLQKVADGEACPDGTNYQSFTIWETKEDFETWRKGPAFVEAHGGGGIQAFFRMFQSLSVMKGPPKPAFYDGILPLSADEDKVMRMPIKDGWRDVAADGVNLLSPEVFVATNRFKVQPEMAAAFEERWQKRESKLRECDGFQSFHMLRRDGPADDEVNYISATLWRDRAAFDGWRNSQKFGEAHGKKEGERPGPANTAPPMFKEPPKPVFWDAKLTLLSEAGY